MPAWQSAPQPAQPPMWQRPGGMENMGRWAKLLGLALIVIGGLILIVGVYDSAYCVTNTPPNCGSSNYSGVITSELVGKLLVVLGLGAMALGAAMKMRFALEWGAGRGADEARFVSLDRLNQTIILVVSIALIVWLLTSVASALPTGG
jgi:hypothetical protein